MPLLRRLAFVRLMAMTALDEASGTTRQTSTPSSIGTTSTTNERAAANSPSPEILVKGLLRQIGGTFGTFSNEYGICGIDRDDANAPHLDLPGALDRNPAWSPDGQNVACIRLFTSPDTQHMWKSAIMMMETVATNHRRLTNPTGTGGNSVWSPGGRRTAFTRFPQLAQFRGQ